MLSKDLLLGIYKMASMQRWNDQIRPVSLTELDKQAHKIIVSYVLGKCEQAINTSGLDWIEIIEAGIFEFLQRSVLTDLKPPLFHKLKEDREKYIELNKWVYSKIEPLILPLNEEFSLRFKAYLLDYERNVNRRIISAAHFYATKWEFEIIQRANPQGYLMDEIREDINFKQSRYNDLKSMQNLLSSKELREFVDICGQLRFQSRWSPYHMVPRTSVLGHMLIVGMVTYLLSLNLAAENRRIINNYFTGIFHDLPEVLTRDVINPVKRSVEGIEEIIKEYEKKEMEKKIYRILPKPWHQEMRMFTENEFSTIENEQKKVIRDGALIKAVDELAAFMEVYLSLKNGIEDEELENARDSLKEKYSKLNIAGIDFGLVYKQFN